MIKLKNIHPNDLKMVLYYITQSGYKGVIDSLPADFDSQSIYDLAFNVSILAKGDDA